MRAVGLIDKLTSAYKEGGVRAIFLKIFLAPLRMARRFFLGVYLRFSPGGCFSFRGRDYFYLRHIYNEAYANERTIEIPLVMGFVLGVPGKRILEVGNVLGNYIPGLFHDVLDKYEQGAGIINKDVVDFRPSEKYDLIVSVSTMEHVGWDEIPREPEKVIRAFRNLKENCLAPGGLLVFTIPLGLNGALDDYIKDKRLSFKEEYFLRRISLNNSWKEIPRSEAVGVAYGYPYRNANVIMLGVDS